MKINNRSFLRSGVRLAALVILVLVLVVTQYFGLRYIEDGDTPWDIYRRRPVYAKPLMATNAPQLAGRWDGARWRIWLDADGSVYACSVERCGFGVPTEIRGSWSIMGNEIQLIPTNKFEDISRFQTLQLSNRLFLLPTDQETLKSYRRYGIKEWSCLERTAGPRHYPIPAN